MAFENGTANRSWKRYSIRLLMVLMTSACAYLSCWGPTVSVGVEDVSRVVQPGRRQIEGTEVWPNTAVVIPLVVRFDNVDEGRSKYYFWLFGFVAKLPLETTMTFDGLSGAT